MLWGVEVWLHAFLASEVRAQVALSPEPTGYVPGGGVERQALASAEIPKATPLIWPTAQSWHEHYMRHTDFLSTTFILQFHCHWEWWIATVMWYSGLCWSIYRYLRREINESQEKFKTANRLLCGGLSSILEQVTGTTAGDLQVIRFSLPMFIPSSAPRSVLAHYGAIQYRCLSVFK